MSRSEMESLKAEYEKAGGDNLYPHEKIYGTMGNLQNGPIWEKAKDASKEVFGTVKWPFVMWWYEKHGGK